MGYLDYDAVIIFIVVFVSKYMYLLFMDSIYHETVNDEIYLGYEVFGLSIYGNLIAVIVDIYVS